MSIVDWDVPFTLISDQGQLDINSGPTSRYILDKSGCQSVAPIRATKDNIPQASGSILHKRYKTGYEIQLRMMYWEWSGAQKKPACGGYATLMHDDLMKHLEAMLDEDGRLLFVPEGLSDVRFFESTRWLQEVTVDAQSGFLTVTFRLDSPYPYALNFTQQSDSFSSTDTLVNGGTAEMFPVIQVAAGSSPLGAFTLTNLDNLDPQGNPLKIVFNEDLPGASAIPAGSYVEIITFRNSVYLNGSGANYKPGIDVEDSDFWGLVVGSNDITIVGDGSNPNPTVTILWADAWA
jgi:hypothetical protein